MENATYAALTRQAGLMAEMQAVANNIANTATTGYRAEGVVFSEYIRALGQGQDSLSMATARVRDTSLAQGDLTQTNGTYDLAIEGDGFFMVATPQGERLTRAGSFTPNENGDLVTADGFPVLDAGGAPVFVPTGAGQVAIASDGTISVAGSPVGQIGLFLPADPNGLIREDGVRFRADGGTLPAEGGQMIQGFLEDSNADAVLEITRMIEVQRAYELGQGFLQREDERMRAMVQALTK
jgi:flagellar basal-body rod protein FlgF